MIWHLSVLPAIYTSWEVWPKDVFQGITWKPSFGDRPLETNPWTLSLSWPRKCYCYWDEDVLLKLRECRRIKARWKWNYRHACFDGRRYAIKVVALKRKLLKRNNLVSIIWCTIKWKRKWKIICEKGHLLIYISILRTVWIDKEVSM